MLWLIYELLCLMPLSEIFHYIMVEDAEVSTENHGQVTGKLYHLRLLVQCTVFVIYKAGREPMPYWW